MVSDWTPMKLSQAITLVSGGTPKTTEPTYWGGPIPWLSVVDFNNDFRHVSSAAKSITQEGLDSSAATLLRTGDLIISARGTVGALAQLSRPMAFNQSCYGVREKEGETSTDYLYYLLKHVVSQLQAVSHGAVFDTITRATFELVEVELPPLKEQSAIASVLGALDDRIENLRATNETLEAIVQTLFKSWFVDFDPVKAKAEGKVPVGMDAETAALFPSEFEESELGLIPKGWTLDKVGQKVKCVGGGTPSTSVTEYWEGGTIAWATPKDLSGKKSPVLLSTERKLTETGVKKVSSGVLPVGTLLMSSRAPIGYLAITRTPLSINQGFIGILPGGGLPPSYLYFWAKLNQNDIVQHANGSTFLEISKTAFRTIKLLVPPEGLLTKFDQLASDVFNFITTNEKETQALTSLRDAMLPKLISGELRLPGFGDSEP